MEEDYLYIAESIKVQDTFAAQGTKEKGHVEKQVKGNYKRIF